MLRYVGETEGNESEKFIISSTGSSSDMIRIFLTIIYQDYPIPNGPDRILIFSGK